MKSEKGWEQYQRCEQAGDEYVDATGSDECVGATAGDEGVDARLGVTPSVAPGGVTGCGSLRACRVTFSKVHCLAAFSVSMRIVRQSFLMHVFNLLHAIASSMK